jgi:endogenous inhibitor of DNA gyrase (YacG/DUF329 family)
MVTIRCPICRKTVPFNDPNMPFCSDRCRIIDLGNWASEAYSIPAAAGEDEFDEMGGLSGRLPTNEEHGE